jgi:hypothetical protein
MGGTESRDARRFLCYCSTALGEEIHVLRQITAIRREECKMANTNGKSRASFGWALSGLAMGLAASVSLCFAQDNRSAQETQRLRDVQEMQRLWEMQRIRDAPQQPFACDSLDPKVCFDIYRRRIEQPPERKAWPAGEFGQATAPSGKAPLPSFKLPSQRELQYGTRIR